MILGRVRGTLEFVVFGALSLGHPFLSLLIAACIFIESEAFGHSHCINKYFTGYEGILGIFSGSK